jgi:hypothetical protein
MQCFEVFVGNQISLVAGIGTNLYVGVLSGGEGRTVARQAPNLSGDVMPEFVVRDVP